MEINLPNGETYIREETGTDVFLVETRSDAVAKDCPFKECDCDHVEEEIYLSAFNEVVRKIVMLEEGKLTVIYVEEATIVKKSYMHSVTALNKNRWYPVIKKEKLPEGENFCNSCLNDFTECLRQNKNKIYYKAFEKIRELLNFLAGEVSEFEEIFRKKDEKCTEKLEELMSYSAHYAKHGYSNEGEKFNHRMILKEICTLNNNYDGEMLNFEYLKHLLSFLEKQVDEIKMEKEKLLE